MPPRPGVSSCLLEAGHRGGHRPGPGGGHQAPRRADTGPIEGADIDPGQTSCDLRFVRGDVRGPSAPRVRASGRTPGAQCPGSVSGVGGGHVRVRWRTSGADMSAFRPRTRASESAIRCPGRGADMRADMSGREVGVPGSGGRTLNACRTRPCGFRRPPRSSLCVASTRPGRRPTGHPEATPMGDADTAAALGSSVGRRSIPRRTCVVGSTSGIDQRRRGIDQRHWSIRYRPVVDPGRHCRSSRAVFDCSASRAYARACARLRGTCPRNRPAREIDQGPEHRGVVHAAAQHAAHQPHPCAKVPGVC